MLSSLDHNTGENKEVGEEKERRFVEKEMKRDNREGEGKWREDVKGEKG